MASTPIKNLPFMAVAFGLSLFLISPLLCLGGTIEIEFTGVDIAYDGTNVVDSDPFGGDPDPLTSVAITENDQLIGAVITDSITQDLYIPSVGSISDTGGSAQSAAGGTLSLELGSGNHLDLNLGTVDINYIDFYGAVQFVFAATVGGVQAQSLPYDLKVGQELGVSFSTQVSPGTLTTSGGAITGFVAAGTGEVEGAAVPEPTSVMLLASVLLGIGMRWSRC